MKRSLNRKEERGVWAVTVAVLLLWLIRGKQGPTPCNCPPTSTGLPPPQRIT